MQISYPSRLNFSLNVTKSYLPDMIDRFSLKFGKKCKTLPNEKTCRCIYLFFRAVSDGNVEKRHKC